MQVKFVVTYERKRKGERIWHRVNDSFSDVHAARAYFNDLASFGKDDLGAHVRFIELWKQARLS